MSTEAEIEELYDCLDRIGADENSGKLPAAIVAKLVAFKMVEADHDGRPKLTPYGDKWLCRY